jgi:hypothetical protein
MAADIPQTCRTQYGIGHGMQEHVRIRMPREALIERDGHAADDQRPASDQAMQIMALPYPERH